VPNLKSQIPNLKSQIALLAGALLLLGAVAWGIGWAAHHLFDRWAVPPPTATVEPTVRAPTPLLLTATSIQPTVANPASTLRPTSTLVPTPVGTPTPEIEVVRSGEGIYQVCRRHCPGRWPDDDVPPTLDEYAHEVARMNDLRWGILDPWLQEGQVLRMPPCPP